MDASLLDSELISALRARGQRVTLPRLLVHRHIRGAERHVTAEQAYAELAGELPRLSAATVYGTLELLDELGFVRRMNTPRGAIMYGSRVDDHHHVICRRCGRMQDVDVALDTRAAERAARSAGFEVGHSQLTLSGL